jgi:hypothetical protein
MNDNGDEEICLTASNTNNTGNTGNTSNKGGEDGMSLSPHRVHEIGFKTGIVGGMVAGCLGALQFALAPLAAYSPDTSALRNLGDAGMLASFATFFLVGFLVRRWTGWVDAAMRAGFVAAVIACLLSCLAVAMLDAFVARVDAPETVQAVLGADGPSAGASVLVALATLVTQSAAGFGLAMAGALAVRPRTTSDDWRSGAQLSRRRRRARSQARGQTEHE